jgi:nucleotide-binding universal stress UspA family protein
MKTILIPVDFSSVSRKAMEYGKLIARKWDAQVILLHALNSPSLAAHSHVDADTSKIVEDSAEQNERILNEWCGELSEEGIDATFMQKDGFTVEVVAAIEHEHHPDLIIMGTTGASGFLGKLIGSNTAAVMERVTRPILLVPHDCNVKEFKHILFATQLEDVDSDVLRKVFEWAKKFEGHVDLIKVNTQFQLDVFSDEFILNELHNRFPDEKYTVYKEDAITTVKGIDHYTEEHSTDLIVMTTSHQNFIERLFNGSVTRQMAMHTHIPLLVYHFEDKE